MSIDVETTSEDRPQPPACGVCGGPAAQYLAAYPTDETCTLGPAAADGVLPVCGDCATELDELTAAWTPAPAPTLADADSIAAAYRTATDACSFCDDAVDGGSAVALDVWSPPAGDGEAYVLCGNCTDVFAEFLRSITSN